MPAMAAFGFQWHLTDRCNQRCGHCYQERWEPGDELDPVGWRALADRIFGALAHRSVSVNLTGGEPLLLADLPALVAHLETKPNLDEAWVITNGTLPPPDAIARSGLTGFKVSVEAADPAIDDAVRGAGHLASVEANLAAFQATAKPVVAMATLGAHNAGCIDGLVVWARRRGLAGVLFERFVPLGKGRAMADQVLTDPQWRAAASAIAGASGAALSIEEMGRMRAYWISFGADGDELRAATCTLGPESMALMPDGSVYPCRRFPDPVGNAVGEDFAAILERLGRMTPLPDGGCAALNRALRG